MFSLEFFSDYERFGNRFWRSDDLCKLLNKQKKVLLDVNISENAAFEQLIDNVIGTLTDEEAGMTAFENREVQ